MAACTHVSATLPCVQNTGTTSAADFFEGMGGVGRRRREAGSEVGSDGTDAGWGAEGCSPAGLAVLKARSLAFEVRVSACLFRQQRSFCFQRCVGCDRYAMGCCGRLGRLSTLTLQYDSVACATSVPTASWVLTCRLPAWFTRGGAIARLGCLVCAYVMN